MAIVLFVLKCTYMEHRQGKVDTHVKWINCEEYRNKEMVFTSKEVSSWG